MNYYKHYIGDFQRDTGHLSLTERGAYLALMHHYYATEKPLPDDASALCRIAGALTKVEQDAVKAVIRFFRKGEEGLIQDRIEAELEKASKRSNTNRQIAEAREEARRVARTEHESCSSRETNGQPIPVTNNHKPINPPTPRKRGGVDPAFDAFWAAYPRHTARPRAEQAFARLKPDSFLVERMLAAIEQQRASDDWCKDGGKFIPHPASWLNARRWEDEGLVAPRSDVFEGAK